jgi:hypothetical protein
MVNIERPNFDEPREQEGRPSLRTTDGWRELEQDEVEYYEGESPPG